MNNTQIKPGQVLLAFLSLLLLTRFARRVHSDVLLLLCAPAVLYLVWIISEILF